MSPPGASRLTDGNVWQGYAITRGQPVNYDLIFEVRLLDENQATAEKIDLLYMLSKEGLRQGALSDYWEEQQAISPVNLVHVLLTEDLLNSLRRGLRSLTGYRPDPDRLRDVLVYQVIRGGVHQDYTEKYGDLETVPQEKTPRRSRALTADCYAYAPDPERRQTWRLRYRKTDGSPDEKRLREAISALSPEPGPGNRVDIPLDDLDAVRGRLRKACEELGWDVPTFLAAERV